MQEENHNVSSPLESRAPSSYDTPVTTPMTSASSGLLDRDSTFQDLDKYIALGCLHSEQAISTGDGPEDCTPGWVELIFTALPEEVKLIIGSEASRLLEANWIRLFLHRPHVVHGNAHSIVRVYLLPEDWGRRFIDRRSKSLKAVLRELLHQVDISPDVWAGHHSEAEMEHFDPWATPENLSLFYLFNRLPSPVPEPEMVKNRYSRDAIYSLLDSTSPVPMENCEGLPITGLKTKLYPYQARSASLMIQRESAPQLKLDPRLEVRTSPNGHTFYFGAKDGSFLQEPRFYESNRGGILAETMGLGKTIICLAVVLATKGHMPRIPPVHQSSTVVRERVGSLAQVAAGIIGRNGIPGKAYIDQIEIAEGVDLARIKAVLESNRACYEIPTGITRMNRKTQIPPPRKIVMSSGTIVVVPRNLLHQWQAEVRKHISRGSLKILVMDSKPKRGPKVKTIQSEEYDMMLHHDLPNTEDLLTYDLILFTRNRFEQEFQETNGQRAEASPLKDIHWLRIIIDEGHSFSSGLSNAVLFAKQLLAERRWVVSGTPAKNLVGVEVDLSTLDDDATDPALLRELTVEQRKAFSLDEDNTKAAKALGSLASHFLMVRPWSDSSTDGGLDWEEYIYRHEHQYRKTYSGFSSCFLRTLEGLVVKTRPEDVEKDIILPPMKHRVVYLKPCWFDKMIANLFVQVLRANAITSERSDVDYLFHKNSLKARHSLIRNLRQSNFTWTGFSLDDVASTLETSSKYLTKDEKTCSIQDAESLLESSQIVATLTKSDVWLALSKSHEVGIAVENWPPESEQIFALAPGTPAIIGVTQLLEGQAYVDSRILSNDPAEGLDAVGRAAKLKLVAMEEAEQSAKKPSTSGDVQSQNTGVPSSCIGGQPLTSRRVPPSSSKVSPKKPTLRIPGSTETKPDAQETEQPKSPIRKKKRRLTFADEVATLSNTSPLSRTRVVGTTSAKLTYLMEKVMMHQADEKIIIFYDGDNAAYYLAQSLEMLYVNHRIYARTLDNTKRSQYIALFNEDPDVRVLLIDVACGALGLNLNAASVVLIVNPINRPGIEAQAIKRAHRIGQTREVLVETLVLEGTIEEAIFQRAQKMSRNEHLEAKTLEDDDKIISIIQNAQILPVDPEELKGEGRYARLNAPQSVFGRAGREKYHKFGHADMKSPANSRKKPRMEKPKPQDELLAEHRPTLPILSFAPSQPQSISGPSIFGGNDGLIFSG